MLSNLFIVKENFETLSTAEHTVFVSEARTLVMQVNTNLDFVQNIYIYNYSMQDRIKIAHLGSNQ